MSTIPGKLLFFTPIPASNLETSWHRDQGLLVTTARDLGYEAFLVCPGDAATSDPRMIAAEMRCFSDGCWWKSQRPWAVVFNTWGGTRFRPIWEAARMATPRLLERLDTDGIRSPRVETRLYIYQYWSRLRDSKHAWQRLLAPLIPLASTPFHLMFPGVIDLPMARAMAFFPKVAAESPLAARRISDFLVSFNLKNDGVVCIPHPIGVNSDLPKTCANSQIVAVGRWDSHQKNFPTLIAAIAKALESHPHWSAQVIGNRHPLAEAILRNMIPDVRARMTLQKPIPNSELRNVLSHSKVFVMSSRHESFGIAAAEALCAGCSLVGPGHIPTVPWFCGGDSGTVARRNSVQDLASSIESEIRAWESGKREPRGIAARWQNQVGAPAVCQHIIEILAGIADPAVPQSPQVHARMPASAQIMDKV
jgi:glycosyltransferase involved in cell wall biosynthesis